MILIQATYSILKLALAFHNAHLALSQIKNSAICVALNVQSAKMTQKSVQLVSQVSNYTKKNAYLSVPPTLMKMIRIPVSPVLPNVLNALAPLLMNALNVHLARSSTKDSAKLVETVSMPLKPILVSHAKLHVLIVKVLLVACPVLIPLLFFIMANVSPYVPPAPTALIMNV